MTDMPQRFTQEITEIIPSDLIRDTTDHRLRGIRRLDPRKTCLDCGYLRCVRIRQVDVTEDGRPVFERTESLVGQRARHAILAGGTNRIAAKDLDCFRGRWTTTYESDVHARLDKGLKQAMARRICGLFFPFHPNDPVETHRELHRERTARRHNLLAALLGAVIGGALSLGGTLLYWYLSSSGR